MNRFAVIIAASAALFLAVSSSANAYQPYGMQYASYHMPHDVQVRYRYQGPYSYYPTSRYRYPAINQPIVESKPGHKTVVVKAKTLTKPAKAETKAKISRQIVETEPKTSVRHALETEVTDLNQSKKLFIKKLIPLVEKENERLTQLRQEVMMLINSLNEGRSVSKDEAHRLKSLAKKYRVKGNPVSNSQARSDLLEKVDIIPVSLTLAQAANESAWGKSRFAQEGNNLFGIWTYDPDKGIVPKGREKGAKHLVRKFESLQESVRYYMHNLNSHPAYESLRKIRAQQRQDSGGLDGIELANGLEKYSAKGKTYIQLIQEIIEKNNLAALDLRSNNA